MQTVNYTASTKRTKKKEKRKEKKKRKKEEKKTTITAPPQQKTKQRKHVRFAVDVLDSGECAVIKTINNNNNGKSGRQILELILLSLGR